MHLFHLLSVHLFKINHPISMMASSPAEKHFNHTGLPAVRFLQIASYLVLPGKTRSAAAQWLKKSGRNRAFLQPFSRQRIRKLLQKLFPGYKTCIRQISSISHICQTSAWCCNNLFFPLQLRAAADFPRTMQKDRLDAGNQNAAGSILLPQQPFYCRAPDIRHRTIRAFFQNIVFLKHRFDPILSALHLTVSMYLQKPVQTAGIIHLFHYRIYPYETQANILTIYYNVEPSISYHFSMILSIYMDLNDILYQHRFPQPRMPCCRQLFDVRHAEKQRYRFRYRCLRTRFTACSLYYFFSSASLSSRSHTPSIY